MLLDRCYMYSWPVDMVTQMAGSSSLEMTDVDADADAAGASWQRRRVWLTCSAGGVF